MVQLTYLPQLDGSPSDLFLRILKFLRRQVLQILHGQRRLRMEAHDVELLAQCHTRVDVVVRV